MKKKILIIGSIADFGGREIEVKNIIDSLSSDYGVKLFSNVSMTEKSMALVGKNFQWTSLYKELYNSNFLIKGLAWLNKNWNQSDLPSYLLVSNKVSALFFDFNKENKSILNKQIASVDAVLFCGVFTNGYLKVIIDFCLELNKPFIFRTTGTITEIPNEVEKEIQKSNLIFVHSTSNAVVFKGDYFKNITVVDQSALLEKSLITIGINETKELKFGFIGRFSNEKGILELLDIFKAINERLIVAGGGPLQNQVESICVENNNLDYLGEIKANEIDVFFEKIDVLIIPSYEEAGPLVGIEAMAAGKLIISTRVGAMMERLKDTQNNFWFDINNENSLLEIIESINQKSPETIKSIREINREKYLKNYSFNNIKKQYLEAFAKIL